MLNKRRFTEQIDWLSKYFMVEISWEIHGEELWRRFEDRDQEVWDKAVEQMPENWKPTFAEKFPCENTFIQFYEMNLPDKEPVDFPSMDDLERQAKEGKHKHYLRLIKGLLAGKIRIDDPRVLRCLKEQGKHPTYKRFDPKRRIFEKI